MTASPQHPEKLARLPDFLERPLAAALGSHDQSAVLHVYRVVDAVEIVIRFVVAHGARAAEGTGAGLALRLSDHPSLHDWIVALGKVRRANDEGRLGAWEGGSAICALEHLLDDGTQRATSAAELGSLSFRELRNWLFHGGGAGLTETGVISLTATLREELGGVVEALDGWLGEQTEERATWPVFRTTLQPEAFVRIDREIARYVPLAGDRLIAFGEGEEVQAYRSFVGRPVECLVSFWDEAEARSSELVGRAEDIRHCAERLLDPLARPPWAIIAPIGRGKTSLVAGLATELRRLQPRPVLLHMFRRSDARNNVQDFVGLAAGSLAPGMDLPTLPRALQQHLRRLLSEKDPVVLLDGIDELEKDNPGSVAQLRGLSLAGGTWLFVSRPDPAVSAALGKVRRIWKEGLSDLGDAALKDMLLRTDSVALRDAMLAQTVPNPDGSYDNPFLELALERAAGSPLYLEHLRSSLERLGTSTAVRQRLRAMIDDPKLMPGSIENLYAALLEESAIGDAAAVATESLCLLALARGEVSALEIAAMILADDPDATDADVEEEAEVVRLALKRYAAVLRLHGNGPRAAYRLDHDSFRRFVREAETHRHTMRRVGRRLRRAAQAPDRLTHSRRHLYRHGPEYLIGAGDLQPACALVVSPTWFHTRLSLWGGEAVEWSLDEWRTLFGSDPKEEPPAWIRFVRSHAHLLRRATPEWGPERILHQLMHDYPMEGPVAKATESLSRTLGLPPLRLNEGYPRPQTPEALRFSLDRDDIVDGESGVVQLADGLLCAWAMQGTVQVVRPDGREVSRFATLEIEPSSVRETEEGLVAWTPYDGSCVELWDPRTGIQVERPDSAEMPARRGAPSSPDTLRHVEERELLERAVARTEALERLAASGHHGELEGSLELVDGGLASWSIDDNALRVWDLPAGHGTPEWVHQVTICSGAVFARLSSGRVVAVQGDPHAAAAPVPDNLPWPPDQLYGGRTTYDPLRAIEWDIHGLYVHESDGTRTCSFRGHSMVPNGVLPLPDLGLAASWAFSDAIRVWSVETGEEQVEFAHHRDVVGGVLRLGDGRLVSWSADGTIWTWSIDGASPPQMAVHPVVSSRCAVLGGPQQLVLSGAWSVPLFVHCEPVARFADDGQARLARPPAP